jgi:hypothetical protein
MIPFAHPPGSQKVLKLGVGGVLGARPTSTPNPKRNQLALEKSHILSFPKEKGNNREAKVIKASSWKTFS